MRGVDGYTDRRTRGLNPTRHSWSMAFPFRTIAEHMTMHDFLVANCLAGFWFTPPTSLTPLWVTCDTWQSTIYSRSGGDMVGELQTTFVRSFTPQEAA
jgi:phage-related protein